MRALKSRHIPALVAAFVSASAATFLIAPAASAGSTSNATILAAQQSAAVICPYKTTKKTPKYKGADSDKQAGSWSKGASIKIYQGSGKNGRLKTTTSWPEGNGKYWADASDITADGSCMG